MTCNNRLILLKKHCHLRLRQPNSFVFHPDINGRFPIVCLVYDNLVLVHDSLN